MDSDLRKAISEFAEIVKTVPTNLQEKCFELLLKDYLQRGNTVRSNGSAPSEIPSTTGDQAESGEDIVSKDLHAKTKAFLKQNDLTAADLNELFFKENGEFKPLYDDLGTTGMSDGQIRIALLQALVKAMNSGDFEFNKDSVRSEAKERKCCDNSNFAGNFTANSRLFEKLEKKSKSVKLSAAGRHRLAELIKELN